MALSTIKSWENLFSFIVDFHTQKIIRMNIVAKVKQIFLTSVELKLKTHNGNKSWYFNAKSWKNKLICSNIIQYKYLPLKNLRNIEIWFWLKFFLLNFDSITQSQKGSVKRSRFAMGCFWPKIPTKSNERFLTFLKH